MESFQMKDINATELQFLGRPIFEKKDRDRIMAYKQLPELTMSKNNPIQFRKYTGVGRDWRNGGVGKTNLRDNIYFMDEVHKLFLMTGNQRQGTENLLTHLTDRKSYKGIMGLTATIGEGLALEKLLKFFAAKPEEIKPLQFSYLNKKKFMMMKIHCYFFKSVV